MDLVSEINVYIIIIIILELYYIVRYYATNTHNSNVTDNVIDCLVLRRFFAFLLIIESEKMKLATTSV